jgi:phosphotransferase system HPr (HPr) family protein
MTFTVSLVNRLGLHTRPAKAFAKAASASSGDVAVSYGEKTVNGKSMIALMSLSAPSGAEITVEIDEDAEDLRNELVSILETSYD